MSKVIIDYMKRDVGINFIPWTLPNFVERNEQGKLAVKYKNFKDAKEGSDGNYSTHHYICILTLLI